MMSALSIYTFVQISHRRVQRAIIANVDGVLMTAKSYLRLAVHANSSFLFIKFRVHGSLDIYRIVAADFAPLVIIRPGLLYHQTQRIGTLFYTEAQKEVAVNRTSV